MWVDVVCLIVRAASSKLTRTLVLTQDLFYHNSTGKIIDRANFVGGVEAVNLGYSSVLKLWYIDRGTAHPAI